MSPVEKAVLDGLNKGIQAELAAYVFYKRGMQVTNNDKLRDILSKLAYDEKDHYRILEGQYDSLVRSEMWVTYNDILHRAGLPKIDEKMEQVHDALVAQISDKSTPMQILEIALLLEERARDLYIDLADSTIDPKGKDTYNYLSKFESGHVAKVKKMMEEFNH
jgi:rubrerythrin